MQTTLVLSEIIFYFTVSLTLIGAGILGVIVTYRLVKIAKELEELSRNLKLASSEAGARIDEVIDRLSELPIFSYFLRLRPNRHSRGKESLKSK